MFFYNSFSRQEPIGYIHTWQIFCNFPIYLNMACRNPHASHQKNPIQMKGTNFKPKKCNKSVVCEHTPREFLTFRVQLLLSIKSNAYACITVLYKFQTIQISYMTPTKSMEPFCTCVCFRFHTKAYRTIGTPVLPCWLHAHCSVLYMRPNALVK